jgi:hypothetical protein
LKIKSNLMKKKRKETKEENKEYTSMQGLSPEAPT